MTVRWTVRAAAGVARRRLAQLLLRLRGDTVIDTWIPAGGGTFLFRQESTQRDDLGGGGGRDVKHPNTASPQDPPLVRRSVVRTENRCGIIAPSLRGLDFAKQKTGGVSFLRSTLPPSSATAKPPPSKREGILSPLAAMSFCQRQNDRAVEDAGPYDPIRRGGQRGAKDK